MSDHFGDHFSQAIWVGYDITLTCYCLIGRARLVNCYRCTYFQYWIEYHHWWRIPRDNDGNISDEDNVLDI